MNEYVIKEFNPKTDWTDIVARVNTDDLYGKEFEDFDYNDTVENIANLALTGTGWTIGYCDVTKVRHIKLKYVNALKILTEINSVWLCDIWYDAINKKVNFYNEMGSDKGVYFLDKLNLKELELQGTSYDFITRLIPLGYKNLDITSVNNGCNYIENHQYSNKVITGYWRTKQYTDSQALKDDAELRLEKYSQPVKAYSAKVIDLAKCNEKYSILSYNLGDIITLQDNLKGIKDKVRIVKTIEYPFEPEKNEVEIANRLMLLQDIQIQFQDAADSVDAVTNGDGSTIDGSAVDSIDASQLTNVQNLHIVTAQIDDLSANYASISELDATKARVGNLESTMISTTQLDAVNANISNLQVNKANVSDLNTTNANITNLQSQTSQVNNLLAGNIDAKNIKAGAIQAGSAVIADGAIGTAQIQEGSITTALIDIGAVETEQVADDSITDAKIVNMTANKITAGTIDASEIDVINLHAANITVGTINGNQISNGTIQSNNIANGAVEGSHIASGCITADKIADGSITGDKIASGSIKAAQMNWATHLMY